MFYKPLCNVKEDVTTTHQTKTTQVDENAS